MENEYKLMDFFRNVKSEGLLNALGEDIIQTLQRHPNLTKILLSFTNLEMSSNLEKPKHTSTIEVAPETSSLETGLDSYEMPFEPVHIKREIKGPIIKDHFEFLGETFVWISDNLNNNKFAKTQLGLWIPLNKAHDELYKKVGEYAHDCLYC